MLYLTDEISFSPKMRFACPLMLLPEIFYSIRLVAKLQKKNKNEKDAESKYSPGKDLVMCV